MIAYLEGKVMLKSIAEKLGASELSLSTLAEMCIRSAHENLIEGNSFRMELNPTQRKLDEIINILHELNSEY